MFDSILVIYLELWY